MRWCFRAQMEDLGCMEAKVMQVLDRLQADVVTFSSARLDGRVSALTRDRSPIEARIQLHPSAVVNTVTCGRCITSRMKDWEKSYLTALFLPVYGSH
jgi:hypothetical protein